jgi:predicted AlkP superfamily pyrophosphatase or phosphodiesterase
MLRRLAALALATLPVTASAQSAPPPRLLVVISVDQFSADLFAEYRAHFTGGLKRLAGGVVFPSGYQSHAATETCPGHSTILTGARPTRTGIIANRWFDPDAPRADKRIYCAEDERISGTASADGKYIPSLYHLRDNVMALGERMKASSAFANTRVVAVAGKDRAAIMMGGRNTDQMWFLDAGTKNRFVTLGKPGEATAPDPVTAVNTALTAQLARPALAMAMPALCRTRAVAVALPPSTSVTVGDGRFARKAGDVDSFRASPALDAATLDLASAFVKTMALGRRNGTDLLILGLSATDYVGHRYGTEGSETCIQLMALDTRLDALFRSLDAARIDYAVALTADHGGHDIPERNRARAVTEATRTPAALSVSKLSDQIATELKLTAPVLRAADLDSIFIDRSVPETRRTEVRARATELLLKTQLVQQVFDRSEIEATPDPVTPPESWTLAQRLRASWDARRSGDLIVALKPRVTPIPEEVSSTGAYVATHGSPWDYDRRVPMLFWRKGLVPFEQPNSVETVDILPTLAGLIGLPVPNGEIDGRCLDLIAGPASTCPPGRQWYIGTEPGPPIR